MPRCRIRAQGCARWARAVLMKGGHGQGETCTDWLIADEAIRLDAPRIATRNTHGTGCSYSSAIAAGLAHGQTLTQAVDARAWLAARRDPGGRHARDRTRPRSGASFSRGLDMTETVTIRGAGVVGLCVATELMARGVPVTLRDPAPAPGPHACSWWAGGMLAPLLRRRHRRGTRGAAGT